MGRRGEVGKSRSKKSLMEWGITESKTPFLNKQHAKRTAHTTQKKKRKKNAR